MWYVLSVLGGFAVGWFIHTILSAREFDKLLWQTEKDKQDLINQYNEYCGRLNDKIERLEGGDK